MLNKFISIQINFHTVTEKSKWSLAGAFNRKIGDSNMAIRLRPSYRVDIEDLEVKITEE